MQDKGRSRIRQRSVRVGKTDEGLIAEEQAAMVFCFL
jgi:hypothetical protein